jgi:hypothetical protein
MRQRAKDREWKGTRLDLVIGVVSAAGLVAVLCGLGALLAFVRRGHFRRELAAVRAGRYPAPIAYQRYTRTNMRRVILYAMLGILFVGAFVVSFASTSVDLLAPGTDLANLFDHLFPAGLLLIPPAVFLPLTIYAVLAGALADAPAFAHLRGLPTRPRDLVAQRLKIALVARLPVLLIFEAALALYVFSVAPALVCLALGVLGIFAIYAVLLSMQIALFRWYYPCVPIERTRWAALAPRAADWARLLGMPAPVVYVAGLTRFGSADSAIFGRSPLTIFLSDFFLDNAEWRQRDAFICLLLVIGRRRRKQALRSYGLLAFFFLALAALIALELLLLPSAVADPLGIGFLLTLLPMFLLVGLLLFFNLAARRVNRSAGTLLTDGDRQSAALTGDPLAVMALLNTVTVLSSANPWQPVQQLPTTAARITALDALRAQPGPRAPWAAYPVPSVAPMPLGPYVFTVPLTPEARDATPPPVPAAPYPLAMPPMPPGMVMPPTPPSPPAVPVPLPPQP